jgi:anthraniloyl-CoA monooxygenase
VAVVGGGPGGLYLAILLKLADPNHQVTVLERNPPEVSYGWGVVFSEETLAALRDADPVSFDGFTAHFARWNRVDVRYRGELMSSRGHGFSAIRRTTLLGVLRRRAAELGADLRFGTPVSDTDLAALRAEADLVVGADGVRSLVRGSAEAEFGPRLRPQGGRYVWYGTDLVFDSFTFLFQQTGFGLFQAHAYPFDAHASTFIVECPEPTWQTAGLSEVDEAGSIAFCEQLFAADLGGHRLRSNRSSWNRFPRLSVAHWHHQNLVLLGDAAHTAHFSIGSGTKLAMEDALALAGALAEHPLPAALVEYEAARQPVVERFQQAADDSADFFHRVGQHTALPPAQFGFTLLTRSGRIGHVNLTARDPEFTRWLDSSFTAGQDLAPPPMFAPLQLGQVRVPNRVARLVPDAAGITATAGCGAGLLLAGPVAVRADGRDHPDTPVLDDDRADEWRAAIQTAHGRGALVGLRLRHAGRRAATRPPTRGVDLPLPEGWPLLSASAIRYTPASPLPRAATPADLAELCADYARAARRAADAGFDLLELDCAHGGLLASFLSPLTNHRTDEHRAGPAFPLAVLAAVRAEWPADRVLAVRLPVTDWAPRGLTPTDGVALAREFTADGAQLVEVAAGQTVAEGQPDYRRGHLTALADRVRCATGAPILVGGYLTTFDEVNTMVGAGRADLCLLDLEVWTCSSPT